MPFFLHVMNKTEGVSEDEICGRPLGMAFDTIGNNLIVADAYYGIWSVDLNSGKKTQLVSPNEELDGKVTFSLLTKKKKKKSCTFKFAHFVLISLSF